MAWTKMKAAALVGAAALLTVGTVTVVLQSDSNNNSQPQTVAGKPTASYATPEATLKTLIAALNAPDLERFAEVCTPERAQIFRSRNAGKTDDQMAREMSGMAKALRSYKILETRKISDTEMILHVKPTGDTSQAPPGDLAAMRMRMRKIGSDWKFDGHEGR